MLALLIAVTPLLGYGISNLVPEELPIGKKWFLTASIVFSLALFLFAPWYLVVLATVGFFIGWFPGLLAMLLLLFDPTHWSLLCMLSVLGLLVGTRWRVDKQSFVQLVIGCVLLGVLGLLLPQII